MTKYNDKYPTPELAIANAVREQIRVIYDAETPEEVHAAAQVVDDTMDEAGPSKYMPASSTMSRVVFTRLMELREAQKTEGEEADDG